MPRRNQPVKKQSILVPAKDQNTASADPESVDQMRGRIAELERQIGELHQAQAHASHFYFEYADLYDFAPVGYITLDRQGRILKINSTGAALLGSSREQFTGQNLEQFIAEGSLDDYRSLLEELLHGSGKRNRELEFQDEGGIRWCQIEATCFEDGLICRAALTDITDRRRIEKALHENQTRWETLVEAAPDGIVITDVSGVVQYASQKVLQSHGFSRLAELHGRNILEFVAPEQRAQTLEKFNELLAGHYNTVIEYELLRKDGSHFFMDVNAEVIRDEKGNVVNVILIERDSSGRKEIERKLRESESHYRALVEHVPGIVYSFSTGRGGTFYSPYTLNLLGYTPQQLYENPMLWHDSIHPEDLPGVDNAIRAAQSGIPFQVEYRIRNASGEWRWFDDRSFRSQNEEAETVVNGIAFDITDKKLAEAALHESQEKLAEVFNTMEEGIALNEFIFDDAGEIIDYRILEVNPAFERIATLPREQVVGKKATEIYRMSSEYINDFWKKNLGSSQSIQTEYYVAEINKWRRISTSHPLNNKFATVFIDTTEQKQAEEKLRKSEANLRAIFENSTQSYMLLDTGKKVVSLNSVARSTSRIIYGREIAPGDSIHDFVRPQEQEQFEKMFQQVLDGKHLNFERSFQAAGRLYWYEYRVSPILYSDQKAVGVFLDVSDITERKQAEIVLRESEANLSKAQQIAHIGHWTWDTPSNTVTWSDEMKRIFGLDPLAFKGDLNEVIFNSIHPDDRERVLKMNDTVVREGRPSSAEYRVVWKDGSIHHVWAQPGEVLRDEGGSIIKLSGIVQDITERKHAEEAIKASEHFAYSILNSLTAHIAVLDNQGNIIAVNDKWRQFAVENGCMDPQAYLGANYLSACGVTLPSGEETVNLIGSGIRAVLDGLSSSFTAEYPCNSPSQQRWFTITVLPQHHQSQGVIVIHQDITERKQAELRMQESEARLNSIITNSRDAIGVAIKGVHEFVNPAYVAMFGYENSDELIGTPILNLIAPESRGLVLKNVQDRQEGRPAPSNYEVVAQRKDGSTFHMDVGVSVYTLHDEVHTLVILRDISDRKQAEQKLLESEANLVALIENTDGSIWAVDNQYRLIVGNRQFHINTGAAMGRRLGMGESVLLPSMPADVNAEWQSYYDRALRGENFSHETVTRFSPEPRFVEYLFSPIRNEDGTIRGVTIYGRDITERKRSEELVRQYAADLEQRVRERTAEVQDLYDNAPSGYHSLDESGRIARINQTELKWLGYSREEMLGRHYAEFLTEESRSIFFNAFPLLIEQGWIKDIEVQLVRKDGSIMPVLANSTVIRDEHGRFLRSRTSLFDISKRKEAEQRLHEANAALEKASRLKDEFLANMSHELRTPLNSIMGFSEILLEGVRGPINDHQKHAVQMIRYSGEHLLGLINDILDVSRIEAGKFEIHAEEIDANKICQASLELVKQQAAKKSISLEYSSTPPAPQLWADPMRLKQVLVNLLSNAVKFTPENGEVKLQVHGDPQEKVIRFSVLDTGIGIAEQDLGKLFRPFEQLDSSLSRRHEGSGLGLTLVKKLVELHGGSVEVESVPGRGSRFTISLAWQAAYSAPSADGDADQDPSSSRTNVAGQHLRTGRILIADDNEVNVLMLQDLLESLGHQVFVARHGGEVVSKTLETAPDVILMDLQMPHVSGLEATRLLRADPRIGPVTIIALTAFAMPGDRERCLEAGMNDYISKPFKLKELRDMVQGFLDRAPS